MPVVLVLLFVLSCAGGGTGGTGGRLTLSGTVRSSSQGASQVGTQANTTSSITITLASTGQSTRTNADGSFSLSTRSIEENPVLNFDGDDVSSSLTILAVPSDTEIIHLDLELSRTRRVVQPVQVTYVERDSNTSRPGSARAAPKAPQPTPTAVTERMTEAKMETHPL